MNSNRYATNGNFGIRSPFTGEMLIVTPAEDSDDVLAAHEYAVTGSGPSWYTPQAPTEPAVDDLSEALALYNEYVSNA